MLWQIWWLAALMQASVPKLTAEPAVEWERLFSPTQGWLGSDCAYSVSLGDDRILWLYDDTFIGRIQEGKRIGVAMVRNSIAIQKEQRPETAQVRFVWGRVGEKQPSDFVKPPDGVGWFWFGHGLVDRSKLLLFLWQFEPSDAPSPFNFRLRASWLATVENYTDESEDWRFKFVRLPFFLQTKDQTVCFGNAVVSDGEWVFVYGIKEDKRRFPLKRGLTIARVPTGRLDDFGAWRFYTKGSWDTDWQNAEDFGSDLGFEFTVGFVPSLNKFALVYSPADLSPVVKVRLSPTPFGRWSEPFVAYECPQWKWHPSVFCYAAKAHPSLSAPNELLVTYASNSSDFRLLLEDARFYFPHFVRLRF